MYSAIHFELSHIKIAYIYIYIYGILFLTKLFLNALENVFVFCF